ncbi:hypothetical protein Tco_0364337 [Tanacetum coccineum]
MINNKFRGGLLGLKDFKMILRVTAAQTISAIESLGLERDLPNMDFINWGKSRVDERELVGCRVFAGEDKMDDPIITMEEYIRLEEEKSRRRGKVYNWETATYGKIWDNEDIHDFGYVETEFPAIVFNDTLTSEAALSCEPTVKNDNDKVNMPLLPSPKPTVSYFDDLDFFKDFENEFPAIIYNDAQTSKSDLLTEPILNPQHIDEYNLTDETSLSEYDEEEQNVICFNDLFPFNVIYPDKLKMDTDNDNDKVDIEHSSEDLSVKPLHDLINTDVGAYAHGSNNLLETSHDTSNKFFKTETFVKGLNFNIMTWSHLNKWMSFIFLIKNLYVPFGISFDPKLFYKDGIKLGQTVYTAYPNPMDMAYRLSGRYPIFIFSTVYTAYSLNEYSVFDTGVDTAYHGEWIRRIDFLYSFRTFRKKSTSWLKYLEILKCWSLENFKAAVHHEFLLINATWRIYRANIRGVSHSNSF